jgi:hypothetical protein
VLRYAFRHGVTRAEAIKMIAAIIARNPPPARPGSAPPHIQIGRIRLVFRPRRSFFMNWQRVYLARKAHRETRNCHARIQQDTSCLRAETFLAESQYRW